MKDKIQHIRIAKHRDIFEHSCGCTTEKIKGVIHFIIMCERHKRNGKYAYMALVHQNLNL